MTTAEKQAKSDRIADRKWSELRRSKGIPEDVIQAEFALRQREREMKRAAKSDSDADEMAIRANPMFGMFA